MSNWSSASRGSFGAAGIEGLAEAGAHLRVNGIEHQMVMGLEGPEQSAAFLLQNERDFLAGETLTQSGDPRGEGRGLLLQRRALGLGLAGYLQRQRVLFVG